MTTVSSSTSSTTPSTTSTSTTAAASKLASSDTTAIDWDAIIEASVNAKLANATKIDTKITAAQAKVSAYTEMSSDLTSLKTAAQALRAPSGTLSQSTDVFAGRTAYLTANGDVTAASVLSVTTTSGAQIGSHDVTVSSLAKSQKVAGSEQASNTTDLGYAGVISLGTSDTASADITVTATMSLADLAEAINNKSDTSGVQATVLQVGDSQYRLVLSTVDTGKSITASSVSGDDVLNDLGVTDSSGDFADVLQDSAKAVFTVDGVEITRDSNDISDVIDGATFHLYETTPTDTSVSVEVGTDLSTIKTAVQSLVDAYNTYRTFSATQQTATTTSSSDDSSSDTTTTNPLFGDTTLRNVSTALASALNTRVDGTSLADIGLSINSSNQLELDSDKLDNALLDNLDAVKSLLSFQMTSSSSDLQLLARGTSAPSSFDLAVSVDSSGNLTGASVGGNSSLFTVSGSRIVGRSGTAYAGYSFVYTGTSSQTIGVTTSSGIAEQLYNIADAASDSTSGTLTTLVSGLDDQVTSMQSEADTITSRAEDYRTTLTARYAQIQAAIAAANSTQSYLKALLAAQSSSSNS